MKGRDGAKKAVQGEIEGRKHPYGSRKNTYPARTTEKFAAKQKPRGKAGLFASERPGIRSESDAAVAAHQFQEFLPRFLRFAPGKRDGTSVKQYDLAVLDDGYVGGVDDETAVHP